MSKFLVTGESDIPRFRLAPLILVFDITDPHNPSIIKEVEIAKPALSFAIHENLLFCNEIGALQVFDFSSCKDIRPVSTIEKSGGGSSTIVDESGLLLYLSNWDRGILAVDVSNSESPLIVGSCGCDYFSREDEASARAGIKPYGVVQMEKRGNYIFANAAEYNPKKQREALFVYDVSDPANPGKFGKLSVAPIRGHGMIVNGDNAFVAGVEKILTIDISDPRDPCIIGELCLPGLYITYCFHDNDLMYISGALLYKQRRTAFASVIDISNPIHPELMGEISLPMEAGFKTYAKGKMLYVACYGGLAIVDVSEPTKPVLISTHPATRSGTELSGIETFDLWPGS